MNDGLHLAKSCTKFAELRILTRWKICAVDIFVKVEDLFALPLHQRGPLLSPFHTQQFLPTPSLGPETFRIAREHRHTLAAPPYST